MSLFAPSAGHLKRCTTRGCRTFVLDADVRCSRCGVDRLSFKMFKASWVMGKYVVLPLLAVAAIAVIGLVIQKDGRTRQDQAQTSR